MPSLFGTVLAAPGVGDINLQPANTPNFEIGALLSFAVSAILVIAGVIFFFMLIFGGIRWIVSGGDKAGTEAARSQITAALVGLIIVFSAWAIATLLYSVFGVNILNPELPPLEGVTTGGGGGGFDP